MIKSRPLPATAWDTYPVMPLSARQRTAVARFNRWISEGAGYRMTPVGCILCGSAAPERLFTNDRYGIRQSTVMCTDCGLVYSSPRLTTESTSAFYASDTYRRLYDDRPLEDIVSERHRLAHAYRPHPFDPSRYRPFIFLDYLDHCGIGRHRVCEIGAGTGANLIPLIQAGRQCTGVEYSTGLVARARACGIDLRQGGMNRVEGRYDLVLMIHVLEHFPDPIAGLRRLAAHVDGHLLVEVPGFHARVPSIQNAHNYYFSPDTLIACAAAAGFQRVDHQVITDTDFILALFRPGASIRHRYSRRLEIRQRRAAVRAFKLQLAVRRWLDRLPFGGIILRHARRIKAALRIA